MTRNKIKAVVFDLDGTLIDSKLDILGAFHFAFGSLDVPPPPDEALIHTIGARLEECFTPFLGNDETLLKEAARLFRVYYESHYLDKTRPFDGIDGVLKTLAKKHQLGLATMKKGLYARRIIEAFGWAGLFTAVTGAEEGLRAKPDPEMLLKTIERLELQKSDVLYVGDTPVDHDMASNAGVDFLFVSWGYGVLDGCAAEVPTAETPRAIIDLTDNGRAR